MKEIKKVVEKLLHKLKSVAGVGGPHGGGRTGTKTEVPISSRGDLIIGYQLS